MLDLISHYLKTRDDERIFYQTNFHPKDVKQDDLFLIFNYGLVCNNAHWKEQLPFFDQLGFKLLIHDLRGHFRSSGVETIEKLTFDNFVDDIKEIIDSLGIKKTVMLGHSMGVNITLEFARKYPEFIIGQVLISGTVLPPQGVMFDSNLFEHFTPMWQQFVKKYPKIHDLIWKTSGLNPLVTSIVHKGGFNTDQVPKEFVEIYMNRVGQLPPELFFQCFEEMRNHDIINDLEKIQIKSLIMGGDKDQIIPNYLQYILVENLPNNEYYLVKDGSHVPQVDFPETLNARILYFLESFTI